VVRLPPPSRPKVLVVSLAHFEGKVDGLMDWLAEAKRKGGVGRMEGGAGDDGHSRGDVENPSDEPQSAVG
jgi:hypothetical protein